MQIDCYNGKGYKVQEIPKIFLNYHYSIANCFMN